MEKNRCTLSAMICPTPSHATSASTDAAAIASRLPSPRDGLRRGRTDVGDAEPDQHPPQRLLLRLLDRIEEQLARSFADALERHQPVERQRVEIAGVADQPGANELHHPFVAEALDVERPATREVHDALHPLRGHSTLMQ